jgi:hypothetical protein
MAAGFVQITLVPAVGTVLLEVVILMSWNGNESIVGWTKKNSILYDISYKFLLELVKIFIFVRFFIQISWFSSESNLFYMFFRTKSLNSGFLTDHLYDFSYKRFIVIDCVPCSLSIFSWLLCVFRTNVR